MEPRFGEPLADKGLIASTQLVPPRSVVYSPVSYGRLYLARGCRAHHSLDEREGNELGPV
jgi:p-hydroxybenzoate 3-monooxygenase